MTKQELAKWIERSRSMFPNGAENGEVFAALLRSLVDEDHARCEAALTDYAVAHSGPGRKFVPGVFLQFLNATPDRAQQSRLHQQERERIAAREAERAALAEEWRRARARCERLAPEQIEQISGLLTRTRAPLPRDPSTWSIATVWVVNAILDGDPIPEVLRSAPTPAPQKAAEDRA